MLVLHLDADAYYYEDGKDHTEYDQAAVVIYEMSTHELIECQWLLSFVIPLFSFLRSLSQANDKRTFLVRK